MYKVIEVSKILGVSKVTIYKKIEIFKKDLKPHMHKKKNITYIDDAGVDIIKTSLIDNNVIVDISVNNEEISKLKYLLSERNKTINFQLNSIIESDNSTNSDLDIMIGFLENQLRLKKSEIESLDKSLLTFKRVNRLNKDRINYLEEILNTI
ncbi:MAG: hypothetical protein WBA54_11700 [Acidaminobacteraceae bacterium]